MKIAGPRVTENGHNADHWLKRANFAGKHNQNADQLSLQRGYSP
jgi:hypothetical protein